MGKISEKSHQIENGSSAIIRTVRESDAEAYLTQADELNLTVEQEREWLKSNIEDESHLISLAEANVKVFGQLDFSNDHRKRNAHTGEFRIGVHKDLRGQAIGHIGCCLFNNFRTRSPSRSRHWENADATTE